ncbi:MAG TPA: hypothetical protein VLH40_08805, partial [Atribacteraceae bacterium]|nr:hypothetical protein [Atribacteraceae bacterium]
TELIMGRALESLDLHSWPLRHFGVKEAVLPFNMFPEVDPVLGPEMRSTGEVLGMADTFGSAFFKAEEASMPPLPLEGTVLISLAVKSPKALEVARAFTDLGFVIRATVGTHRFFHENNIPAEPILKIREGRPNIADAIMNREIHLIVNTPMDRLGQSDDASIRQAAIRYRVPYITTLAAALASAKGIEACRKGRGGVRSLQSYHRELCQG